MPENISKFEVLSEERFLFALKGMPEIVLSKKMIQELMNSYYLEQLVINYHSLLEAI